MTTDADDAIRLYLRWIQDPTCLVDHERIAELQARADEAEDPLERLRAYSELEQVGVVDERAIRAGFVKHAKAWAAANDISPEAFRRMDVNPADLKAAGLLAKRGASKRSTSAVPGEVRKRKPRVAPETIVEHMPAKGEFTIRSVAEASGASEPTVRRVIDELVALGDVLAAGTAKNTGSRGRAPLAFRRR